MRKCDNADYADPITSPFLKQQGATPKRHGWAKKKIVKPSHIKVSCSKLEHGRLTQPFTAEIKEFVSGELLKSEE